MSEQEYGFDGNAHGRDVTLIAAGKLHLLDPDRRVQLSIPGLAIAGRSCNLEERQAIFGRRSEV